MSEASRSEDGQSGVPEVAPPRAELKLIPYFPEGGAAETAATRPKRDWGRVVAAASLVGVVLVGAAAAAAHVHAWRIARAEEAQTRVLAHKLENMAGRLDSLEANRSRDELASLKKVLAEIKAGAASAREAGGAVAQLVQRVDKLEKDQGARFDKLGDRIEHDSAAKLAEVTARLDKLEAKTAAAVATVAATPSPKPAPTPPARSEAVKATPAVSNETTGSIDRPPPRLRGYYLSEVHNGYAMIDSPQGEFAVGPGDLVPGGGRVLRIERHGRGWAVVTTQGQIVASD